MHVVQWLHTIPPDIIYVIVFFVVSIESLGIPVPGELTLMAATLLSTHGEVSPIFVGLSAAAGAIMGDSIGYYIGHRYGEKVLEILHRLFPKHFNKKSIGFAEKVFKRWGMWAVFFGRFVALLRIFAGPIAGILKMPYRRFLAANAAGGIAWAGLVTSVVYFLGVTAEHLLQRLSWVALLFTLVVGTLAGSFIKRKLEAYIDKEEE